MLSRIWGYLKQLFRSTAERAMDPEIEIEQAITEARAADTRLRNQAAKVIAHRTQLESRIEKSAAELGEARETAKQALLRAEEAKNAGNAADLDKWTRAAQSLAMRIQAAESNVNGLKEQYEVSLDQAETAKSAVQQNAMRVQELAAKRMQLLGKLEQAKMQESVNSAMQSMSASMEVDVPSLARVEERIEGRLAGAKAHTELREVTPEGAEAELREAVSLAQADAKLDELKKELGLS
ncbi:PspA/IM30 family protein [soil metagenome]